MEDGGFPILTEKRRGQHPPMLFVQKQGGGANQVRNTGRRHGNFKTEDGGREVRYKQEEITGRSFQKKEGRIRHIPAGGEGGELGRSVVFTTGRTSFSGPEPPAS